VSRTKVDSPTERAPKTVTAEACRWAYRLFLGREAESDLAVQDKVDRLADLDELRQEFMSAAEFKENNPQANLPVLSGSEPALPVEDRLSPESLDALFQHVQTTWQHLGETEPYYSVLTAERYESSRIEASLKEFHDSGRRNVAMFKATLNRNAVDLKPLKSCLEFGCGVGRVTRWLAPHFDQMLAYDISRSHLQLAQGYLERESIDNVDLRHVARVEDLQQLPKVDMVFSVIVLQHNPPPIIAEMIGAFIDALNPGGVAYFQVPTYRKGYRFSLKPYLQQRNDVPTMEMHVLPQRRVFEIIADRGGRVLETLEDNWTGARHIEVSNTFVVQKVQN
jgi:2-polyprenyl-3-methyl-5-hydroxy-6-metoxy-1,4-benzoquinol methylase